MVYVKESIRKLEQIYGYIPCKFAKGDVSVRILKMLEQSYIGNVQSKHSAMIKPEIDLLIMFGRGADMVTPFVMNRTYEGILDEFFNIEQLEVTVPTAIIDPKGLEESKMDKDKKELPEFTILNLSEDNDTVFNDLRNRHFETLDNKITAKLKKLKEF